MIKVAIGLVLCAALFVALWKEYKDVCRIEDEINESLEALYEKNYPLLLETRKYYNKQRMRRG